MSQKKNILKHTLSMGFATYIAQGFGIVTSIAIRAFLGPAAMGIWAILQVILEYCGYASFGTTRAMARDYPILRGRGEHDKAEHLKDLTTTFSMIMSFIPAFIIVVYLIVAWRTIGPTFRIGLLFLVFFLFFQRFYDVVITLLRSDKRFDILSKNTILNAIGTLAIVFIFVWPWHLYGLFVGTAVVTLGCLWFVLRQNPYRFRFYWNVSELWQQLRLAIPLLGISFFSTFYKSMDKLLIAKFLGFSDVGLYSIAMMIGSLIFAFPMMLSSVMYPHTLEAYGRRSTNETVRKHLVEPTMALSIVVPILCGLSFYLVPMLVYYFLPKFMPGIPAMKVYLVGTFFVLLAQFSSNILMTLDKYWINYPILVVSSVCNLLLNYCFIKAGFGLNGVAWGTTLSYVVYGLMMYMAATSYLEAFAQALRQSLRLAVLVVSLFAGIALIDLISWPAGLLVQAGSKCVLLIILAIPFLVYLDKRYAFFKTTFELFKPKTTPPPDKLFSDEGSTLQ